MADYKFNFRPEDSLESRRETIADRIAGAKRYIGNVKDPQFKEGAQKKLDYYLSEEEKLNEQFREAAGGPSKPERPEYSVYNDPTYQRALQAAQAQFNMERTAALGEKQYRTENIERQLEERIPAAEQARRRLAGNFARRGMAGGRYGALTRAEAEANAREISLRTGLREQIAELDRQYTAQFGAEGTDWLGTYRGSQAQQAAIEQALQNRLAGLTTVG